MPQKLGAPFFRDHPRPILPWRSMTNVLRVAALQIGNPVVILIFVEANDGTCHVVGPAFPGYAALPVGVFYGALCSATILGCINSRAATFWLSPR